MNYIMDRYHDLMRVDKEIEVHNQKQAARCLRRWDKDMTEWLGQKAWESSKRGVVMRMEAIKALDELKHLKRGPDQDIPYVARCFHLQQNIIRARLSVEHSCATFSLLILLWALGVRCSIYDRFILG